MRIVLNFSPFSKPKPSPPLRLADVLLLQDHEEDRLLRTDSCRGPSDSSKLLRVAARLFFCFNCGKLTNKVHGDQKKEGDGGVAPPLHVTDGPELVPREICGWESKFNVGIGCCLLHLIAESKNELRNITELKIQMESVLQTVKEGLLNKDFMVSENLESNEVLFDQKCDDAPREEDCLQGMDRLEAELEVELERFLSDLDKSPTNPPEKIIEESKSCSLSHGEECCPDSQCGVPPRELERKLHELLETRQEQQIKELQAALESAKKELREKEGEISWWKDTAHLMLEHVKKTSLNFQYARHHV
ncbi:hypothetical protein V6N13_002262 [Hibiscus sabdariffa]|uniref:Uncharacterized protein n=1 Tax=Hibiscus sabdariffa TaxID=183260 RepID=A0ABR2C2C2_9ROSI